MVIWKEEERDMWIYYALILLAVTMFGGGFLLQDTYRAMRGSGLKISMESAFIGSLGGLAVLLAVNGFALEFTPFTLMMAAFAAINEILFVFCAFKALEYINLSLFSLFAMLGGMALPFLLGIILYGEGLTAPKILCVLFIVMALLSTVEKGGKKKGGIFYVGIFVLNGMSGVISKLFTSATLPKTSTAGYSVLVAASAAIISGATWLFLILRERRSSPHREEGAEKRKLRIQSYFVGASYGILNKVANFLSVVALLRVDASVQFPMITGGTMIVSTVLSLLGSKKPRKRELVGVAFAFVGMLALLF